MFFIKRCEMRSIYRLPLNIDPVVSLLIGSSVNIAFSFPQLDPLLHCARIAPANTRDERSRVCSTHREHLDQSEAL